MGYPSTHIFSFLLCHVYKTAMVTQVGGFPYLSSRVTLAGDFQGQITFVFALRSGYLRCFPWEGI